MDIMAEENRKHRIWDVSNVVDPQLEYKIPLGTGGQEAAVTTVERFIGVFGIDADSQKLYAYDEFQNVSPKRMRFYFVARNENEARRNRIWRVYLKNKPIFEFDDSGEITSVFPYVFPMIFTTQNR